MDLSMHRARARNLFIQEKEFFRQIEEANNEEELKNLLYNLTPDKSFALIYLLYFIYKKEIPLLKKARIGASLRHLKKIVKYFQRNTIDNIFLKSFDENNSFLRKQQRLFPFLVEPILNKH